jgi:hypothetical protein
MIVLASGRSYPNKKPGFMQARRIMPKSSSSVIFDRLAVMTIPVPGYFSGCALAARASWGLSDILKSAAKAAFEMPGNEKRGLLC